MIEELKNQLKDLISDKEEQDNYKIASIPERLRKNKKIALLVEDKVEDLEFFYLEDVQHIYPFHSKYIQGNCNIPT